ncbi:globin domain-containing protein [uncultured Fusobacterium sp.]|uniref:globin domain-containing protein n=1 Tax=uncultured Fusobacterium sp. TaxID=159267 RepID=UPI0025FD0F3D|nr:globin domain-containing protein [uncultured Fusobacterium sp.]
MLSTQTIEIVKATVPVLKERGVEITQVFYKNMLGENPDIRAMFDAEKQKDGSQPKALAMTVLAAAQNIDKLEVLAPAVNKIAKTHVGLNVKPEHYPIVGKYLLGAIKEVLGDAATDEIINAWAEAYGVIADIFIKVEADMYAEQGK